MYECSSISHIYSPVNMRIVILDYRDRDVMFLNNMVGKKANPGHLKQRKSQR